MVRCAHLVLDTQMLHQCRPEVGCEQLVPVGDQLFRHPVICNYVLNEDVCQIRYYPSFAVRYESSELSKAIGNYHDSVVGFFSHRVGRWRELHDEVHCYRLLWFRRDLQGLQESVRCMFVMLASSAYRALPDVIFYRDSHLREEVRQVQDVKHLRNSRMAHE
jgi:hypothetical protein